VAHVSQQELRCLFTTKRWNCPLQVPKDYLDRFVPLTEVRNVIPQCTM
jgi:hypothetical protein